MHSINSGLLHYISLVFVWPLPQQNIIITWKCFFFSSHTKLVSYCRHYNEFVFKYSGNNKFNCGFPFILWMHVYTSQENGSFSTSSVLFHSVIESLQSLLDSWIENAILPPVFFPLYCPLWCFSVVFFLFTCFFYQTKQTDVILTSFSDPHNFNWVHWTFTNIGQKAEVCFFVKNVTHFIAGIDVHFFMLLVLYCLKYGVNADSLKTTRNWLLLFYTM